MMIREVGDVVALLHDVVAQLDRLSVSELNTLNRTLMHAQEHTAEELNRRRKAHNRE